MRRAVSRLRRGSFVVGAQLLYHTRAVRALHAVAPAVRRRREALLHILIYHRVADEADPYLPPMPVERFRRQMSYLAGSFRVLDLGQALEAAARGELPPRAASITFDDGYRDNFTNAFPILRDLGLPATIFLATSAIGNAAPLWHDVVFRMLDETTRTALPAVGQPGGESPYSTPAERASSRALVLGWLRELDDPARGAAVARLVAELGAADPGPTPGLMLTWEEVRAMRRAGIAFGSHTVSHPILSRVPRERLVAELVESKRTLEGRLGGSIAGFAYPSGRREDFDDATKSAVRDAGYAYAVTTIAGVNRFPAPGGVPDPFELRRVGGSWEDRTALFATRLALEGLHG